MAPFSSRLRDTISQSLKESNFDSFPRRFAPTGLLEGLILPNVVRQILAEGLPFCQFDEDLVAYVVSQARKLFAICVKLRLSDDKLRKAMLLFKEKSISDTHLPFHFRPIAQETNARHYENVEVTLDELDPSGDIWDYSCREDFCKTEQWAFLAPVFSTRDFSLELTQSTVVPFPVRGDVTHAGGYGRVDEIQVQEGHMKDPENLFGSKLPSSYALKQIHPNSSDYHNVVKNWTKELANLRVVTRLRLPSILRFVTAFTRGDGMLNHHYLICEWADGGNLRDFWKNERTPSATPAKVMEVITQLTGLSDALCALHYSVDLTEGIVHGDLKPENILIFKSGPSLGTLKIGDWGLSKEKDCKTTDQNNASLYRASVKYEPPEMSEGVFVVGQNILLKTRSRLYDIWSLGCVMLEFVVWLAHGYDEVHGLLEDTGNVQQFWEKASGARLDVNARLQLRAKIRKKMEQLEHHPACAGTALGDLLRFIRDRALVVHLPSKLAALELEDLIGLSHDDRKRLKPPSTTPINLQNDSENPHGERSEIVPAQEGKPTIAVTPSGANPVDNARPSITGPSTEPRAKATELLMKMRRILKRAENEAEHPSAPATSPSAQWIRQDYQGSAADSATPRSVVLSEDLTATNFNQLRVSDAHVGSMPPMSRLTAPAEVPRPGSLETPRFQEVGDGVERPFTRYTTTD